jgi:D-alanyl-D-alanine carboxypeptidase
MNNKSTFYSFLFTGILLVSVLLSRTDSNAKGTLSYQDSIKNTSLTASIITVTDSALIANNSESSPKIQTINSLPALKNKQEESIPIKNENAAYPENLKATIAFIKDLTAKKELFSKNTDKHWAIASITKLMTALVALEKNDQDKTTVILQSTINSDSAINGNFENFFAGEKYTIKDLIRIMLTVSSNKAATAIADFYGQQDFINEMNYFAKKIGMSETNFKDCTGLSVSNQSTTEDLAKLTEYILTNKPEIFEYTKLEKIQAIDLNSGSTKIFKNINYFAGQPDFLGGKTGTIDASKQNMISLFNYQNHKILIIILGSEDRFSDTENLLNWTKKSYKF